MIKIDVLNAEEVVEAHSGKLVSWLTRTARINLKKRIESSMAKKLQKEFAKGGLKTRVTVEHP